MFLVILNLSSGSSVYFVEDEKGPGLFEEEIFGTWFFVSTELLQ